MFHNGKIKKGSPTNGAADRVLKLTVSEYMEIQAQGIVSNTPVAPLDGIYNSTLLSLDRPSIYLTALLKEEKRGKRDGAEEVPLSSPCSFPSS